MIVLDASVLIAYLDNENEHHDRAVILLAREIDDDFVINSLTLAEVLVVPVRDDRMAEVHATLAEVEVRELPFPADTGSKLAQLRSDTGLKMPDCCVLLAVEETNARLASFDGRLGRTAKARNLVVVDI